MPEKKNSQSRKTLSRWPSLGCGKKVTTNYYVCEITPMWLKNIKSRTHHLGRCAVFSGIREV